ncbi:MAG TPA: glycosyltransferase [Gemmataceae bacterium]|nr:glycosyltransferase [Gemmataceae bacterium]
MMDGLVSVLIPTYNRAYCLPRAIDSALAQTYPRVEILVVDDGSSDNTAELMRERYGEDERVRYVRQANGGVSAARNHGLRLARGDYVAFLDSDDVWKLWKLQVQLACLAHLPAAGMIWSDMEAVDPEGHVEHPRYLRTMYHAYRWFTTDDLFQESYPLERIVPELGEVVAGARVYSGNIGSQMFVGNLVHTSTALVRRERVEKVKAFREDFATGEDYEFHFRTCREGPVAFVDLPSIQYQVGMADRLTRLLGDTAINYLKTITAALAHHRNDIALPKKMIRQVLARANAWVGGEFVEAGDYHSARRYLARSLAYNPWQPRILAQFALSCLPGNLDRDLRGVFRGLKASLRRLHLLSS